MRAWMIEALLVVDSLPPAPVVQQDTTGYWVAIGTLITALAAAVVLIMGKYREYRSSNRADAMKEYDQVFDVLHKEMENCKAEIKTLKDRETKTTDEIINLYKSNSACREENALQKGEIRLLQAALNRLQSHTGTEAPGATVGGIVIADTTGTIKVVSPALAPHLGWLAKDLVGKPIEKMIPERHRQEHLSAFSKLVDNKQVPWSDRVILTEALNSMGQEVPVAITLSSFQTPGGDTMFSAEIRKRVSDQTTGT
jgi:PAS domain S-box-containing protein